MFRAADTQRRPSAHSASALQRPHEGTERRGVVVHVCVVASQEVAPHREAAVSVVQATQRPVPTWQTGVPACAAHSASAVQARQVRATGSQAPFEASGQSAEVRQAAHVPVPVSQKGRAASWQSLDARHSTQRCSDERHCGRLGSRQSPDARHSMHAPENASQKGRAGSVQSSVFAHSTQAPERA